MKHLLWIYFVIITSSFGANFDFFSENPAYISLRDHQEMKIPGLNFQLQINNTLLQFDDIKIFQTNRLISPSEKEKLTSDDLDIELSAQWNLFHFGYKNWDFSYTLLASGRGELLEKDYSKLILYGNDKDYYQTSNGEKAEATVFSKIAISYGHPTPIYLSFFSTEKKNTLAGIQNFLSGLPFYVGLRFNLYYPYAYGYVPLSKQEFGSSYLETFGNYQLRFYQTDEDSSANLSIGAGWGFNAILPYGTFSFYLDDLLGSLRYRNLKAEYQEGVYQDSLTHFDDDYDSIDETNSETYRIAKRTMRIKPTIEIGYEHFIHSDLSVMIQYKHSIYDYMNGFSTGIDYRLFKRVPLQFLVGKEKNYYFEIKTGLIGQRFDFMIASTFYYGMFRYAKGMGLKMGLTYKF